MAVLILGPIGCKGKLALSIDIYKAEVPGAPHVRVHVEFSLVPTLQLSRWGGLTRRFLLPAISPHPVLQGKKGITTLGLCVLH
jgi:hypothetical protein